jgi:hypothetical protein
VSEGEDSKPPWQHLIGQLEIARERGQTGYALEGLCAVRMQAAEQGSTLILLRRIATLTPNKSGMVTLPMKRLLCLSQPHTRVLRCPRTA